MSHGHGLVSVIGSQSPTGLGSARPSIQIAPEALLFVRDVDAVRCDPKRVPRLQTARTFPPYGRCEVFSLPADLGRVLYARPQDSGLGA